MYARMGYSPPLSKEPFKKMEVEIEWNDFRLNPAAPPNLSGVYIAYNTGNDEGHSGYFGVQLKPSPRGGQFIFSMWDVDRFTTTDKHSPLYQPQKASLLAWPISTKSKGGHCYRHCLDCAQHASQKAWAGMGLTTGTQCLFVYPDMRVGDKYKVVIKRSKTHAKLQTKRNDGFGNYHKTTLGEKDKKIKGGRWEIYVFDLKRKDAKGKDLRLHVGDILLEGTGQGFNRLTTFDEMLGCTKCEQVQHTDTRYGPVVTNDKNKDRHPIKMQGLTKKGETSCGNLYWITGDQKKKSVSFTSGPFTAQDFPYNQQNPNRYQDIWP